MAGRISLAKNRMEFSFSEGLNFSSFSTDGQGQSSGKTILREGSICLTPCKSSAFGPAPAISTSQ